jgi:hypothetical protein
VTFALYPLDEPAALNLLLDRSEFAADFDDGSVAQLVNATGG